MKRSELKRRTPLLPKRRNLDRHVPLCGLPEPLRRSKLKTGRKNLKPGQVDARTNVRDRAEGKCELITPACSGRPTEYHHRTLRSAGGDDHPDNLRYTCHACHMYAHAHPQEARSQGWIISRYEEAP